MALSVVLFCDCRVGSEERVWVVLKRREVQRQW